MYTSVQAPYQLFPQIGQVFNASSLLQIDNSGYVCNSTQTNICEQLLQLQLTPTAGQCQFNATVSFNFTVGCQAGYTGSCSQLPVPNYNASINIFATNVCPQVIE